MEEYMTIRLPAEMKKLVEGWAEVEERSASYIVRRLIEAERARRAQSTQPKAKKQEAIAA